ncbi:TonB-dependent receptor [uncultured Algibacter sp.]|uniref:SusC/RagA family TonB-linked outer membrane protein n=1 Tax=uncultured Algibacter sp. TaxID=298659 RepID=UPI002622B613|nr:TonB-dependent receptor [uncultured Algibacter sp.]
MVFKKNRPLRNSLFLFLAMALSFSNASFAQNLTVTGNITSQEDGLPLAGVNILIANTNKGALSDFDGNYSISNVPTDAVFEVSYLGFETQTIIVGDRNTINIVMKESTESLDEVVVIGYGTSKKSELTEAVSSVKSDEIIRSTGTSIESALQGRLSGVRVISNEGTPGGGLNINVRGTTSINGSNDPLYVIDGVPILKENVVSDPDNDPIGYNTLPADPLSGLNPGDIASIEVLKDASATAIYGSRGANGVVIITTKKGKSGKLKVDYDGAFGISTLSNKLDLLDAPEYYEYRFLKDPNDGVFTNEDNRNYIGDNPFDSNGLGIDWQDVVYREAYMQNHKFGFSGGNETVRFYTSLGYMDQEGIIVGSEFKRYSGLANINVNTEKFRMDANVNFSQSIRNGAVYASGGPANAFVGTVNKVFYASPLGDENTINDVFFDEDDDEDEFFTNPFLFATEAKNDNVQTRLTGNVTAYYDIAKNLEVQARIGGNISFNSQEQYFPRETTSAGRRLNGFAQINKTDATRFIFENLLRYKLEKDKHSFKAMVGYTLEKGTRKILRVANQGFEIDNTGVFNIGLGTDLIPPRSNYIEQSLNSYLSRINYNYKKKYFLTLTGRIDGSSKFPSANKYAFFPSGSVAWNVHRENFLKKSNIVNNLKLRYSIGSTGNQAIPAYSSLALLDDVTYSFGGGIQTGLVFSQLANEDLKWETVYQNNVGIDMSLFNNRVGISIDAFNKKTKDALLAVPVSSVIGLTDSSPFQNIGEIENKGIEFSVNTTNIQKEKFSWNTNFNISFTENKIVSLGEISEFFAGFGDDAFTNIIAYREGGEIGEFYGFKTDGIILSQDELDNAPTYTSHSIGSWRLKDISGPEGTPDGVIDENDRTIIGSSQPDFFGGITNNFNIGNLDFSFFFEFSVGQELYNANNANLENQLGNRNKLSTVLTDATKFDETGNLINEGRLPAIGSNDIPTPFDAFVEDASYLRLQNVTLGYTVPVAEKLNITKLRFYISANNLWLLTDYSGYDPDVNTTRNSGLVRGVDFGSYPKNKNIIWGVNLTF